MPVQDSSTLTCSDNTYTTSEANIQIEANSTMIDDKDIIERNLKALIARVQAMDPQPVGFPDEVTAIENGIMTDHHDGDGGHRVRVSVSLPRQKHSNAQN